jgi:hypothetical protein
MIKTTNLNRDFFKATNYPHSNKFSNKVNFINTVKGESKFISNNNNSNPISTILKKQNYTSGFNFVNDKIGKNIVKNKTNFSNLSKISNLSTNKNGKNNLQKGLNLELKNTIYNYKR